MEDENSIIRLRNLFDCVSQDTMVSAYYALFHSVISYEILAWGGAPSAMRLFSLQRKVIRILAIIRFRDGGRSALEKFNCMSISL